MCELTMLLVRLPVNSRLTVINFWESQKLVIQAFETACSKEELGPLALMLFKDQLY